MTLSDTGPLVAIFIADDPANQRCQTAIANDRGQLLTTDACITETLHLLRRAGGYRAQRLLWNMIRAGELTVYEMTEPARLRAGVFMDRYSDQPCDYADATLLVAAEDTGIRRIFTVDGHFFAYRLTDGEALVVFP